MSARVAMGAVLACLLTVSLIGCGGSGGGGVPAVIEDPDAGPSVLPDDGNALTVEQVIFRVYWAERSADGMGTSAVAPSSALSFKLSLLNAADDLSDYNFTANRHSDPACYTETYTLPGRVRAIETWLFCKFFALPDGQGPMVGRAMARVQIHEDGTGLDAVTTEGLINSVTVLANQSLLVDERKTLAITARNAEGAVLALPPTPGSVFWNVVSGQNCIRFDGAAAIGVEPGMPEVTATVDGVVSPPREVQVILQEPLRPEIHVNKIAVGVPLNAQQDVIVRATDEEGMPDSWSVTPFPTTGGSNAYASWRKVGTGPSAVLRIEAKSQTGAFPITVVSRSGVQKVVKVTVYNRRILRCGSAANPNANPLESPDLEIAFTDMWTPRWPYFWIERWDEPGGPITVANLPAAFDPDGEGTFYPLGCYAVTFEPDADWVGMDGSPLHAYAGGPRPGDWPAMMVRDPGGESGWALAPPTGYEYRGKILDSRSDDGSLKDMELSKVWWPIAPSGYRALGIVVSCDDGETPGEPPPLDLIRCVHEDLLASGSLYPDADEGFHTEDRWYWPASPWHFYYITPSATVNALRDEYAYLAPTTFVVRSVGPQGGPLSKATDLAWVLKVRLPTVMQADSAEFLPQLPGYEAPPDTISPQLARSVLIPFTCIFDAAYWDYSRGQYRDLATLLQQTPLYRVDRSQGYTLMQHVVNPTDVAQPGVSLTLTTGVTDAASTTFGHSAGIEVGMEWGMQVTAKTEVLGSGVEVQAHMNYHLNLNYQFSYETSSSRATMRQESRTFSMSTPARTAAALWQMRNTITVLRHEELGRLTPVASLGYGENSYCYSQYPPVVMPQGMSPAQALPEWFPLGMNVRTAGAPDVARGW